MRVVLSVDFMRPLPTPLHALNLLLRWAARIPENRWEPLYHWQLQRQPRKPDWQYGRALAWRNIDFVQA